MDSPLPYCIRALPGGIRLILDNAITNAVRHGGASAVRITLARPADSPDTVTITIDDNGCGIPAEERSSVFERFTRGSTAGKTGSGLGLALVAQQAALHGGRTTFHDSPLGGGARLLVELRDQPGPE